MYVFSSVYRYCCLFAFVIPYVLYIIRELMLSCVIASVRASFLPPVWYVFRHYVNHDFFRYFMNYGIRVFVRVVVCAFVCPLVRMFV